MRHLTLILFTSFLLVSCKSNGTIIDENLDTLNATKYANTIKVEDLKSHLYKLASEEFKGRRTGEEGQKLAANYLADFYKNNSINSATNDANYFQHIPVEFLNGKSNNDSENVLAFIEGSEKPEEVIVISAHYDHLGIDGVDIYFGADDDASGTTAILEIAQAFKTAKDAGIGPKRSLLFLHLTGEEQGLLGSSYYASHPLFPLENTVTNLNIDMIGRIDKNHEDNRDFVYLIGSDKLSADLHQLSEDVNTKYTNLTLDYTYNDENDPNRYYYRSDHYNFAKNNIPVIFYFNGTHEDYHRSTDTPDKIDYELLAKRTQLIFYTAWEIANRDERIILD